MLHYFKQQQNIDDDDNNGISHTSMLSIVSCEHFMSASWRQKRNKSNLTSSEGVVIALLNQDKINYQDLSPSAQPLF